MGRIKAHEKAQLEKEREQRFLRALDAKDMGEVVGAAGQESEISGAKATIEVSNVQEKEAIEGYSQDFDALSSAKRYKFDDYKRLLAEIFASSAENQEFPHGWLWHIAVTDKGLVMFLRSPDNRQFTRAFAPCNVPEYDRQACDAILESAWVAINKWEKAKEEAEKGLIPPNGSAKPAQ